MEDIKRNLQETNTNAKRRGEIDSGHTTGIRMGHEGHSNVFKNTTRQHRLEWRC
tara:strand:+ start:533 stop:694 length:162 start_codon:yes stop_codon:yes gene_type:complete